MGHRIEWDNSSKTVILQQYLSGADKNDLFHLARKSAEMLHSVPHTVHLIIDEREIKLSLNTSDLHYLEKLMPQNQGAVIMVIHKNLITYKTMVQRIGKAIAPKAFNDPYFATSLEEARALLQKMFAIRYP